MSNNITNRTAPYADQIWYIHLLYTFIPYACPLSDADLATTTFLEDSDLSEFKEFKEI